MSLGERDGTPWTRCQSTAEPTNNIVHTFSVCQNHYLDAAAKQTVYINLRQSMIIIQIIKVMHKYDPKQQRCKTQFRAN